MKTVNAPYVVTRQVTATKNNGSSLAATITAPAVDGYAFVAWVGVATEGDVGAPYVQKATSETTKVWDSVRRGFSIVATALYQRS